MRIPNMGALSLAAVSYLVIVLLVPTAEAASAPRTVPSIAALSVVSPSVGSGPGSNEPVYAATLDRELWAGISLGDAIAGAAVLGGGAVAVAVITGSTTLAVAAAAAAALSFVVYDPGTPPVVSPPDLPRMSSGGVVPDTASP